MDDIADLVVTPFRELVEKGKLAVENAGDTQPMLKAAQNLVKEGERALKKIEPLCRKHLDEYGSNFVDALKENDDIANFRTELTDMLWEFDDYIEPEDFEAEKFAELQALSRKAAPRIYDILMRMKLEVPVDNDARSIVMMRMSRPSSPPPIPLPPLPVGAGVTVQSPVTESRPETRSGRQSAATVEEATAQLKRLMQSKAGPDEGLNLPPLPGPPPAELPPRPPSTNPWDVKTPPVASERRMRDDFSFQRRAPVVSPDLPPTRPPREAVSPVSPERERERERTSRPPSQTRSMRPRVDRMSQQSDEGSFSPIGIDSRAMRPRGVNRSSRQSDEGNLSPTGFEPRPMRMSRDRSSHQSDEGGLSPTGIEQGSYERGYNVFPGQSPRSRTPNSNSFMSTSIPEDFVLNRTGSSKYSQSAPRYSQTTNQTQATQHLSRPESLESDPSSVFDTRRPHRDSAGSENRSSEVSAAPTSPTLGNSELSPTSPIPPVQAHVESQKQNVPVPQVDYGPIPVETERQTTNLHLSTVDNTISVNSSFYFHKGFCEGAQEIIRGGIGIRKTKRPGFTTAVNVARCLHCFYELDFKEVEYDIKNEDRANFVKNGIGFRIRFLQKCHVATRRVDDVLYSCVFCVQQGRTLHGSDATVFTSQLALFQHLARHPRPLPAVPGITVVDGPEVPPHLHNNYDIHFKNPPEEHPVVAKADEMAFLPTGVTKEAARRMYNQRLLADRTPALELAQGARVTGITWPEKYVGEWALAWHDGTYASIPTDIIRLDQPPSNEIKMSGTSQIRATTRWKFNPKDKDKFKGDWLKFDKDEVITNISWPYQEYWCWAGTNSKGKWGIFPRAFIDQNSVQDITSSLSDQASILSNEKNRSMSMLTRFSSRKSGRNGRPPSIAGSTGSHETQPPTLPPPNIPPAFNWIK